MAVQSEKGGQINMVKCLVSETFTDSDPLTSSLMHTPCDDAPTLPKEKHNSILLPADVWSRDAMAVKFKVVSLCVSCWCWQVHYGRSSCVGERFFFLCVSKSPKCM